MRGMAISIAVISTSFIFFERADNIELGIRLLSKAAHYLAAHYLAAEKAWQLDNDTRSPKRVTQRRNLDYRILRGSDQ